eukprot:156738-Hanusia_phi.AAC.1
MPRPRVRGPQSGRPGPAWASSPSLGTVTVHGRRGPLPSESESPAYRPYRPTAYRRLRSPGTPGRDAGPGRRAGPGAPRRPLSECQAPGGPRRGRRPLGRGVTVPGSLAGRPHLNPSHGPTTRPGGHPSHQRRRAFGAARHWSD